MRSVYFLGGTSTITLNGNNCCRARVLGAAIVTINVSDNAFLDVKAFDTAQVTVNVSANGSASVEGTQQSQLTVNAIDDSVINLNISDEAQCDLTMDNNAYGRILAYNSSVLNYTLSGLSAATFEKFQKATVSNIAP